MIEEPAPGTVAIPAYRSKILRVLRIVDEDAGAAGASRNLQHDGA